MIGFLSHLWDFIWMFFSIAIFVAWLIALFSIVGDLFRDRQLSGWAKAVWLAFLIFIPFLTGLVYLIARGAGMAERSTEQAESQRAVTEDYIRSVTAGGPAEEIARGKALLDAGTISPTQFETLKVKALA